MAKKKKTELWEKRLFFTEGVPEEPDKEIAQRLAGAIQDAYLFGFSVSDCWGPKYKTLVLKKGDVRIDIRY